MSWAERQRREVKRMILRYTISLSPADGCHDIIQSGDICILDLRADEASQIIEYISLIVRNLVSTEAGILEEIFRRYRACENVPPSMLPSRQIAHRKRKPRSMAP